MPARGWTGEAYQGHIFWDELFIFPVLQLSHARDHPVASDVPLPAPGRGARGRRGAPGYKGAMFPWQSGSDGQEETQAVNLNPRSQRWVPDNSYLQRHVGSAVAYNVWQYFQVTHDLEFLHFYGAELILEIARFWSSIAVFNDERGRYEIRGVMGPDEFHDGYPDSATPGLNNNAYTNFMAVWVLCRALEVLDLLSDLRRAELTTRLGLSAEEIARWDDISRRMYVPFHEDGIISQFEGYEKLRELDWQDYRARYGNIQRLDLILEAENDSPNRYKLSKQADVLMLFYLFSAEELGELFERLGYPFEYETIPTNVAYYSAPLVPWLHAVPRRACVGLGALRPAALDEVFRGGAAKRREPTSSRAPPRRACTSGPWRERRSGERVSTGIEVQGDVLRLNPELPQEMERLDMRIRYRGHSLDLRLTRDALTVRGRDREAAPILLSVDGKVCEFVGGSTRVFRLKSKATGDVADEKIAPRQKVDAR